VIPPCARTTGVQISTTWLNIAFLVLAAILLVRFFTSGGLPMLKMMGGSPGDTAHHDHHGHERHE
jgi:hypothetical protein